MKKKCSRCKKIKDTRSFDFDRSRKDGKQRICRVCKKELSRKHYLNNKEKYRESKQKTIVRNYIRHWVRTTINHHRYRGFIVNIAIDELESVAKNTKICRYCGNILDYSYYTKDGKLSSNSPTLDRIDNECELNLGNTQIICRDCNTTKGARTHKEFIKYCESITKKFN